MATALTVDGHGGGRRRMKIASSIRPFMRAPYLLFRIRQPELEKRGTVLGPTCLTSDLRGRQNKTCGLISSIGSFSCHFRRPLFLLSTKLRTRKKDAVVQCPRTEIQASSCPLKRSISPSPRHDKLSDEVENEALFYSVTSAGAFRGSAPRETTATRGIAIMLASMSSPMS